MYNNFKKEDRFALTYTRKDGTTATCYPRSVEQKNRNIEICKERGYRVVSCKKLYPFSTNRNQHNFELISNICSNRMHDMWVGEIAWDDAEYARLESMKEKADEFFGLEIPVAWLPYDKLCEAKELASLAIMHRQDACIAAGRPDLVALCAE